MPPVLAFALVLAVAAPPQVVQPPPRRTGPEAPAADLVTMRGCLDGRQLWVLEHDSTDLSGVRVLRLKGPKGVMRALADARSTGDYIEVSGRLHLDRADRLDARRKWKAGSKTTVFLGASAEQERGSTARPEPVLEVEAFTPLDGPCPRG
jgi:hypothetical protein